MPKVKPPSPPVGCGGGGGGIDVKVDPKPKPVAPPDGAAGAPKTFEGVVDAAALPKLKPFEGAAEVAAAVGGAPKLKPLEAPVAPNAFAPKPNDEVGAGAAPKLKPEEAAGVAVVAPKENAIGEDRQTDRLTDRLTD